MTGHLDASLIIVSRDRPDSLRLVITALRHQRDVDFELIVVTNAQTKDYLPSGVSETDIKHVTFDQENISAARNVGIEHSNASLIAFCDDDCIPEPFWLKRILKPFDDPQVGIAGGYVRGRNGISFQWRQIETNCLGEDHPVTNPIKVTRVYEFSADGFQKVQGTNCAFRKSALLKAEGFDPTFQFYLDETDLCLRLGQQGWKTAIVPLAEVQHGFEESSRRRSSRMPKSLELESFSKGYFLAKHAPDTSHQAAQEAHLSHQRTRLVGFMNAGWAEPRDVKRLLDQAKIGFQNGINFQPNALKKIKLNQTGETRFNTHPSPKNLLFFGARRSKNRLFKKAKHATENGDSATVFCFSRTSLFHKRWFHKNGFWIQTGGIFGKSVRNDTLFSKFNILSRVEREKTLLSAQRPFNSQERV